MRSFFITTMIVSLIVGCASQTHDLLPPQAEMIPPQVKYSDNQSPEDLDILIDKVLTDKNEKSNYRWWSTYQRAQIWKKKDSQKACLSFLKVSQDPMFPLHDIAYLRAKQVCAPETIMALPEATRHQLQSSLKRLADMSWLKKEVTLQELEQARRDQQHLVQYELLLELSKRSLDHDEKVNYTKQAIALTKKFADFTQQQKQIIKDRLYQLQPRLNPQIEPKDYLKVALDFRKERKFRTALKYFRRAMKNATLDFDTRLSAYYGYRKTYKLMQDKEGYIKATSLIPRFTYRFYRKDTKNQLYIDKYLDAQMTYARTLWTEDRYSEAMKILKIIARRFERKSTLVADANWLIGRMYEERQDYVESVRWFENGLALLPTDHSSETRNKLLWALAWNLRRVQKLPESIKMLEALNANSENPYHEAKYLFWLAKSYQQQGEEETATNYFKQLVSQDRLGYYGLLSYRELKTPIVLPSYATESVSIDAVENYENFIKKYNSLFFDWLVSVNELELAERYLDTMAIELKKEAGVTDEAWIYLFAQYAKSGSYLKLFQQIGYLSAEQRNSVLEKMPELIFPRPYKNIIAGASEAHKISKEYLYSIIRQESAFDPSARSHADAFGLMQLLPSVAKKTANHHGLSMSQAEDLFQPHVNIPLGAAHLRHLWEQWDERFILSTASYNASASAIQSWMKTRYRGDALEFIEDIPYEETRNYIKLVLRNLVYYQALNTPERETPFPEWTLSLTDQAVTSL